MSHPLTTRLRGFGVGMAALMILGSVYATPAVAQQPVADEQPDPAAPSNVHAFEDGVYRTPAGISFAPDRVLVKFRSGVTGIQQISASASVNATVEERFTLVPGLQVLTIRGFRASDAVAAAAALSRRPEVEYAMPDYEYELAVEPDDPSYPGQWALPTIGAPAAWSRSSGSGNVTVAVIDTGVDLDHPDLAPNLVPGWNFISDTDNPDDDHGHGTHVAGTIGAVGNNTIGVSGVNWSVSLMPLKICDQYGSCPLSAEIAAIEFAVAHGAHIANASFGAAHGGWQPESDAIAAAGNAGLLYVAAAGNNHANTDSSPFYPAGYELPNIVAVGASSPSDELASFSNFGQNTVDLVAPGEGILSTVPGDYGYMSGTSMASPHVAGAAALVKALHPSWTPQKVRRQLIGTATPIAGLEGRTASCGRLNIDGATTPSTVVKPVLCVTRQGSGQGSVTSSPTAVDCGSACAAFFTKNTLVTLTASPAPGYGFGGWSGPCSGTGACSVTLAASTTVGATFIDPVSQGGWTNVLLTPPAGRDPVPPGTANDQWESFFNVSLSADGKRRAKAIFNAQEGWCYFASTDTGGVFMERKTSSGWVADGVITAPTLGPEPADRWMNCASFGTLAKLSGDGSTLVVGNDFFFDRCVAFVYRRTAGTWTLDGTLYPEGVDAHTGSLAKCGLFGLEGSISHAGDRIAIYAPQPSGDNYRPRVDVFARGPSGWAQEQKILPPTAAGCPGWPEGGGRLAMSGDGATILIGDPLCSNGLGRVYRYSRTGSTWTKLSNLTNPDSATGRWFGRSVAIAPNGLTAAIGVTYQPGQPDAFATSWVFELVGGTWQSRTRLEPGAADAQASFVCTALVRAGQRIVCASYETHGFNSAQGSIYVFNRPTTGWSAGSIRTRLFAPFGHAFDRLGAASRFWYPAPAVREDGKVIDATVAPGSLALGGYHDHIGYEFRR